MKKFVVWVFTALGTTSLISKAVEKWAERSGYLDDPTKAWRGVIELVASFTHQWFFWPLVTFVCGLTLGFLLNQISNIRFEDREATLRSIGVSQLRILLKLEALRDKAREPWPLYASSVFPELQSLFLASEKAGIAAPPIKSVTTVGDNGNWFFEYLSFVGQLLADGHYEQAIARAGETKKMIVERDEKLRQLLQSETSNVSR